MQVVGTEKNLFPLSRVISRLNGYFMDREGNVYSNRGSKGIKVLAGSKANSWSPRYFTMDGASFNHADLLRRAQAHVDFIRETAPTTVKVAPLPSKGLVNRSHAANLDAGILARGRIIATVQDGKLSISDNPAIHLTQESLTAEMERLALTKPGVKFVSLQITGSVVAGGVNWG